MAKIPPSPLPQKDPEDSTWLGPYLKWALPRIKANYAETLRNSQQFFNPSPTPTDPTGGWEPFNLVAPTTMIAEAMGTVPVALADVARGIGHTASDIYNSPEVQGGIRDTGHAVRQFLHDRVHDMDLNNERHGDPVVRLAIQPNSELPRQKSSQLPPTPTGLPPAPTFLPRKPMPGAEIAKHDVGYINQHPEAYTLRPASGDNISGNPRNLTQMEPEFERRFSGAIQEYYARTHNTPVEIINGSRYPGDQQRIWDAWERAHPDWRRTGYNKNKPAYPGTSPHEFGFAGDTTRTAAMRRMDILAHHGLEQPLPKSDPNHLQMIEPVWNKTLGWNRKDREIPGNVLTTNGFPRSRHPTSYYHHSATAMAQEERARILTELLRNAF